MQRIPLVDIESASPDVQSAFRALPVPLNIFRMMAHAPMSFRPLMRLGQSILSAQQLEPKLREYAILQAVHSYGGRYEWIQHVPIAEACGATAEQIKAIEDGNLGASCFDEKEKAFLAFVDESAKKVRCSDAAFAAAKKHLSDREIVETILTIGYYQMLARLTECTDTELDEPVGTRVVDSLKPKP
ncbi:MAG TPA: carboxymuconolactone decarboxylase family protein [Candidatus Limnocylindrales bacterium]|nr:carboxymuconolactone decarboxylase family protein [Candidatus Limnocylindrales bacterium]